MKLLPETKKKVGWVLDWWTPSMREDWVDLDLGRGGWLVILYRTDGARFEIKKSGGWIRATCFDGKGDIARFVPRRSNT